MLHYVFFSTSYFQTVNQDLDQELLVLGDFVLKAQDSIILGIVANNKMICFVSKDDGRSFKCLTLDYKKINLCNKEL